MNKESGFTWKLGMFVLIGLLLFVVTIYLVGKQNNLFGSTFRLKSHFKSVSGLKEGNSVRFSGINIGSVDGIQLTSDTNVLVELVIKKEFQEFIKSGAIASIGSDGLVGDKILTISPGDVNNNKPVKDNELIASRGSVEMEDVMRSVKSSVENAGVITAQLAEFSYKMNNGNGVLSRLVTDEEFSNSIKTTLTNLQASSNNFARFTDKMNSGKGALGKLVSDEQFGKTLDSTMTNLKASTKGLSENMEAAKHNFLLKGYFKKKERAEARKKAELKKQELRKKKNNLNQLGVGQKKTDSTLQVLIAIDSTRQ